MRAITVVIVVVSSLLSRHARAETAAELQARGEDAAKRGDYADAIEQFKAADKLEPRASHACLIALAYTRRNLWPQAEIFRTLCHERATPTDPLPAWIDESDRQIDHAIAMANVAEVKIVVEPASAELTVSSFAPDERFSPRVIHLSPGTHQIFATAPGYKDAHELVEIRDKAARTIKITMQRVEKPAPPERSLAPWVIVGAGVAVGAVGGVLHATWYKHRYDQVIADVPGTEGADLDRWNVARDVVIGCYAASALTIGAGLVLRATVWSDAPELVVMPTAGGGVVSIGWQR